MKNHMPLKKKKKASWSSTQESDHMMMISFTTTTLSLNLREITTHETSGGAPEAFLAAPPVITKRF